VAGEPSSAFWTLAPAALLPPPWRIAGYGAALAFGAGIGLLRMAAGGHFFFRRGVCRGIHVSGIWLAYRWLLSPSRRSGL